MAGNNDSTYPELDGLSYAWMQNAIDAEKQLRQAVEAEYYTMRGEVEALAIRLAGAWVDEQQKRYTQGLRRFDTLEIIRAVSEALYAQLQQLQAAKFAAEAALTPLQRQVTTLEAQLKQLDDQNWDLRKRVEALGGPPADANPLPVLHFRTSAAPTKPPSASPAAPRAPTPARRTSPPPEPDDDDLWPAAVTPTKPTAATPTSPGAPPDPTPTPGGLTPVVIALPDAAPAAADLEIDEEEAPTAASDEITPAQARAQWLIETTLPVWVEFNLHFEPTTAPDLRPPWFEEWWAETTHNAITGQREFDLLQMLGRTGEMAKPVLSWVMTLQMGKEALETTVYRLWEHLQAAGLVEVVDTPDWGGKRQLVGLTENGQTAYQLLFGQAPVGQWRQLQARHSNSVEHAYLCWAAARYLETVGYTVDLWPAQMETDNGPYRPDLTAELDGMTLYLEAEIDNQKNKQQRQPKWLNYWYVARNELYVIVVNKRAQKTLLGELRWHATQLGLHGWVNFLRVTDLPTLGGWEIWTQYQI